MGKGGTDVAKGVSDIILVDDDFSSIVNSVKEGRAIFSNIKKILFYMLSSNIGELLFVLLGVLIFRDLPLIAVQLLWINLITDLFPVISIGLEPHEPSVMTEAPRKRTFIVDKKMIIDTAYQSVIFAAIALVAYAVGLSISEGVACTMAFAVIIFSQMLFSISVRTESCPVFVEASRNKFSYISAAVAILISLFIMLTPVRTMFGFEMFSNGWVTVILLSLVPFLVNEVIKLVKYLRR